MLSHDNMTSSAEPTMKEWSKLNPEISSYETRLVSYLPLSHIAGLKVDFVTHIYGGL